MSAKDMLKKIEETSKTPRITALSNKFILSRVSEFVSTGCQPLDLIMGGGVPVGRMIEIYGNTSTGKSLLAAHILAETQAVGGIAALMDPETATSEVIMKAVGIDADTLLYSIPETVEEIYETIIELLDAKAKVAPDDLMVIIWDSVAATTCEEELKRVRKTGLGKGFPAHAQLISQMCRIIKTEVARQRLAFIFINQAKEKLGVLFGDKVTTFGGRSIGFYSSVRLEMKHIRVIKDLATGESNGIDVRVIVAKNKIAQPFGRVEFPIIFGYGIDEPGAVYWWLMHKKLLTGTAWKHIILTDGTDIKFQKKDWNQVFYEYEDAIRDFIQENY